MRTVLQPGKEYDFLTPQEMHKGLNDMQGRLVDALVREELRGVRPVKRKLVLNAGQNVLTVGGPAPGYIWSLLNVVCIPTVSPTAGGHGNTYWIQSDTTYLTPFNSSWMDYVVNQRNNSYTKGAVLLLESDILYCQNNDPNYNYIFTAQFVEVPAEMVGKLYV